MATSRSTRRVNAAPDIDGMMRLGMYAARLSVDLCEAGAKSFIAHQIEVANLKRRLTTIAASTARQGLR